MQSWHIVTATGESKALSPAELKRLADEGQIAPNTLIRRGNDTKAYPAARVKGLFGSSQTESTEDTNSASPPEGKPTAPPPETPASPTANEVPNQHVEAVQPPIPEPGDLVAAAPAVPHVVEPTAIARPRARSKVGLYLGIAFGMILTAGASFGAAFLVNPPRPEKEEQEPNEIHIRELEQLRKQIDKKQLELEAEKSKLEALEGEVNDLKQEKRKLEDKNDQIQDEIESLTASLKELKQWQQVDVVFANPGQQVLGFRSLPNQKVQLALKAEGASTGLIMKAAIKADMPIVPADPTLVRKLYQNVESGHEVTGDLEKQLSGYYGVHEYAPLGRAVEGEWVTFWHKNHHRQVFALFRNVTEDSLSYIGLDGKHETVKREFVLEGTALRGRYETIQHSLDESQLLDYSLMRAAQMLQSPDKRRTAQAVAVAVRIDEIDRSLSETFIDPEVPGLFSSGERFEAEGAAAMMIAGLKAAEFTARMADFRRRQKSIEDGRADARKLEDAVSALEADVYAKLTKMGVKVYEHRSLRRILKQRGVVVGKDQGIDELGREALLTHSLVVDVRSPRFYGDYEVSVRLRDLTTDTLLFAENSRHIEDGLESIARRASSYRQYHLDSGRLALLENEALPALETPPIVGRPKSLKARKQLVYVEEDTPGNVAHFRPLFSFQRRPLPTSGFSESNLISGEGEITRSRAQSETVRYILCRTLQACMPHAGRVLEETDGTAIVAVGKSSGLKQDDSLRVIRYFDDGYQSGVQGSSPGMGQRLPIRVLVTNVHEDGRHCDVQVQETGFEKVWYEQFKLMPGDIVVPAKSRQVVIGFAPPIWADRQNPNPPKAVRERASRFALDLKSTIDLGLKAMMVQVRDLANPFAPEVKNRAAIPRIKRLDSPQAFQLLALREAGATHGIAGELYPDGESYKVVLGIYPLDNPDGVYEALGKIAIRMHPTHLPE